MARVFIKVLLADREIKNAGIELDVPDSEVSTGAIYFCEWRISLGQPGDPRRHQQRLILDTEMEELCDEFSSS
jgi:hypothetical protein